MTPFFRRIRRHLANDNQFLKYSRYAIGEIMLVVVGILIALWINSTYQDYKNEEITKIYLNDFKRDLKADSILLAERIEGNDVMIQSIDSILYMVNTKTEFSSADLQTFAVYNFNIMHESYFIPETGTIRQFESDNNILILSKEVKDKLFKYYSRNNRNIQNMETSLQLYQHNFFTRDFTKILVGDEFLNKYRGIKSSLNKKFIDEIRTNKDYLASLFLKKGVSENQNSKYLTLKTKATELIEIIELELKK